MAGYQYNPNAIQTALNELNAAYAEISHANTHMQALDNVQCPGGSKSTEGFHRQLVSSVGDMKARYNAGRQEILHAIEGLKAVQRQYAAGEEITWQSFQPKDS